MDSSGKLRLRQAAEITFEAMTVLIANQVNRVCNWLMYFQDEESLLGSSTQSLKKRVHDALPDVRANAPTANAL